MTKNEIEENLYYRGKYAIHHGIQMRDKAITEVMQIADAISIE